MAVKGAQAAILKLSSSHLFVCDKFMYSAKTEAVNTTSFITETLLCIKTGQAMYV
jgi:hypothetical protein